MDKFNYARVIPLVALIFFSSHLSTQAKASSKVTTVSESKSNISQLIENKRVIEGIRNGVLRAARKMKTKASSKAELMKIQNIYQDAADSFNAWIDAVVDETVYKENSKQIEVHPNQYRDAKQKLTTARHKLEIMQENRSKAARKIAELIDVYYQDKSTVKLAAAGLGPVELDLKGLAEALTAMFKGASDFYNECSEKLRLNAIRQDFLNLKLPNWNDISTHELVEASRWDTIPVQAAIYSAFNQDHSSQAIGKLLVGFISPSELVQKIEVVRAAEHDDLEPIEPLWSLPSVRIMSETSSSHFPSFRAGSATGGVIRQYRESKTGEDYPLYLRDSVKPSNFFLHEILGPAPKKTIFE